MKRILSLSLALVLALCLCVPALAADFSDVPATHTFYSAVMDCAGKGIVGGYSDGTFRPSNTVTRSNFCVMLSRAFYADEVAANQADPAYTQVSSTYPNFMALYNNGIVKNTEFETTPKLRSSTTMNKGIDRYDMAQLMTNIMKQKGFAASDSEKSAVIAEIADFDSIASQYQDAVLNVYALGIITGYADGSFKGDGIMNRGQACVVIYRMMQYSGDSSGTTPSTPETPSAPTGPETPKSTTIAVSKTTLNGSDTGWVIADNGWETGKLNNGKPITEENVLELLTEAEKIWPTGLSWDGQSKGAGTNFYHYDANTKGYTVSGSAIAYSTYPISDVGYGCGGFASMLSDYVFGTTNNPTRKLDDRNEVRPGDIIVRLKPDGSPSHINIALSTAGINRNTGNLSVKTADGDSGDLVTWSFNSNNYAYRIDDYQMTEGMATCVIYTRYPD